MLLLLLSLTGCTEPTSFPTKDQAVDSLPLDTGEPGTEAPWFCAPEAPTVAEGEHSDWLVTTSHYSLEVDGDRARAEELGRMSEAAWLAFTDWFGAQPEALPLGAGFYESLSAKGDAMERDGVSRNNAAGFYSFGSLRAYTSDQPTIYYDHGLFLHELVHQWHHLSASTDGGQGDWYVEGLAEMLSRHDWDGECLRLARLPLLSEEDFALQALSAVEAVGGADLDAWLASDAWPADRPVWYAFIRWLHETQPELLHELRAAYDADSALDVPALLGPLDSAAFEAWLRADQEPFETVYIEWLHRDPATVIGFAEYSSVARLKGSGEVLRATVSPPTNGGMAGLLLGWDSEREHTVMYMDASGGLTLGEVSGGQLLFYDAGGVGTPSGDTPMRLSWEDGEVQLRINGIDLTPEVAHSPAAGFALYATEVTYSGLSW